MNFDLDLDLDLGLTIVSLILTLGWKNEKQPSGPTELDPEAGNLVCPFLLKIRKFLKIFRAILGQIFRPHNGADLFSICRITNPATI